MQTVFQFNDLKVPTKKVTQQSGLVLTERDLDLISFVHEMKFASLEDLHFKFFRVRKDGIESTSLWWARKRLTDLVKLSFLSRVYAFNERKSYFLGTTKSYLAVARLCAEKELVRPLEKIDFKTFDHDKQVLQMRLQLEEEQKVAHWVSDRQLFHNSQLCLSFGKGNQPDALYTTAAGVRVAFELEIATKARKRYQDKIRKYVQLMRSANMQTKLFDRVQFVCAKETIAEFLTKETRIYGDLFEVIKSSQIISHKLGA